MTSRGIAGARVLELGGYLAGPFATLILANLGANVIKVESLRGDEIRHLGPPTGFAVNRGKRSLSLDLKTARGKQLFERLLRSSDVVIQNLTRRATRDLGITYEECRSIEPTIVYCHITAFGPGPRAEAGGTNPLIEALVGTMAASTRDGETPTRMGASYFDQMAGALAAIGVLTALAKEDNSKASKYVEVGLFETGVFLSAGSIVEQQITGMNPERSIGSSNMAYESLQASDGRWIFCGAVSEALWRKFCQAMDLTEFITNPDFATRKKLEEKAAYVKERIRERCASMPSSEMLTRLRNYGVPCAPVNDYAAVLREEQLSVPGKLVEIHVGSRMLATPGFPITSGLSNVDLGPEVPALGEHSMEIVQSLGYDTDEVLELVRLGVMRLPTRASPILTQADDEVAPRR